MSIDYQDFEKAATQRAKTSGDPGYWWRLKDPKERCDSLIASADVLKDSITKSERSQANLTHARLYGNVDLLGFGVREYGRTASAPQQKIALNVCCSCVDTLTAKVAKTRPRPMFLTDGGSFTEQRQAQKLDKFMRGLFYETKIYEKASQVFVDSSIFDIGALKFAIDPMTHKMVVERVFPDELYVDETDAKYGEPRQLFQSKMVSKEVLLSAYGKNQEIREAIEGYVAPEQAYLKGFGDVVEVWEAWHLPSYEGAKDGCHCIAMKGAELFCEPWTPSRFPFAFLRHSKRVLGFWGQSLVERLAGIQLEINRLLRSVSEQLRRKGKGRIFCKIGSKVNPEHLRNGVGDIITYTGDTPPVVDAMNHVAPEEFLQLDRLYQRAFQIAGISELSAGAKKPSGLDAAVALREFSDIESERFSMVGKAWEQFFLDCAEVVVDILSSAGLEYPVKNPTKRGFQKISWKDIDLDRDAYVMQMFPVSSLPQTPAYRRQTVTELVNDGYIPDKATALRLLDYPDLESETNLALAALDDADETISAILDKEPPEYRAPDEFSDPQILVARTTAAYLHAKHQGVDDERLTMLVQLIDAAKMILAPPMPAEGAPMPGGEMAPPPGGAPSPEGAPPMNMAPTMQGGDINVNAPQPASVPPLIPQ